MYDHYLLRVLIASIILSVGQVGASYTRVASHDDWFSRSRDGGASIRSFVVAASQAMSTKSSYSHGDVIDARKLPVPFEQEKAESHLWGYRASDGTIAIVPRYYVANAFLPEGTATVVDDVGWAVIDLTGHVLLRPYLIDNAPDGFKEGLARFSEDRKLGFFNRAGRIVIPARYDGARHFSNGLAPVCIGCRTEQSGEHHFWIGGRWGYLDHFGKMVIEPRFDNALPFEDGRALVEMKGEQFLVDKLGELTRLK